MPSPCIALKDGPDGGSKETKTRQTDGHTDRKVFRASGLISTLSVSAYQ